MSARKKAFSAKPLSEQQKAMIGFINAKMEAEDPEPESYAPNLNLSTLSMHIRIINFNLWKSNA